MKKASDLLFNIFILYIILIPIWPNVTFLGVAFHVLFLVLDIYLIIKNRDRFKFDKIDLLFLLVPLFYILPLIFSRNVLSFSTNIKYIIGQFITVMTVLVIRRFIDKENIKKLLLTFCFVGVIYFFISFIYQCFPRKLMFINIISYFGDTYVNSIDRFYGTLVYCNASAIFFSISVFISLFFLDSDQGNKYMYIFILFINFLGLLVTFSKMVTIFFGLVVLVLLIYSFIRKKYKLIEIILVDLLALVIPGLLMVSIFREFLINLNLIIFVLKLVGLFGIYLLIILFNRKLYKNKILFCLVNVIVIAGSGYFLFNPVSITLDIKNVSKDNDYIISDFILDENKDYTIDVDLKINNYSNVEVVLGKLYVKDMHPIEEEVISLKEKEKLNFSFNTGDDFEYYYLKFKNLNKDTNIKIKNIRINDEDYLFNSFLVPYQFVHQLELMKYDRESMAHRFNYYKDSMTILKDKGFLIGSGAGTFAFYKDKYNFKYLETSPHSYLFELLLDIGIYGLIYVLCLIVFGIKNMIVNRNYDDIGIWFCIFSLLMLILPFDLIYSLDYFKILLILAFLVINDYKEENI